MNTGNGIKSKYHCINCGKTWGEGVDAKSSGICIDCLTDYVNKKKISKGFDPCFGKLNQGDVCNLCKYGKFCIEKANYGIK